MLIAHPSLKRSNLFFETKDLRLLSKYRTAITHGYRPELEAAAELAPDGVQWYQKLIALCAGQLKLVE